MGSVTPPATFRHIDLNSDLGEREGRAGVESDEQIMRFVSSANIACGFHAGSATIMRERVRWALERRISIGAHIGYLDLPNFGRVEHPFNPDTLYPETQYQLGALAAIAGAAGGSIQYVKPHGALYNQLMVRSDMSEVFIDSVIDFFPALAVMGLPGSALAAVSGARGVRYIAEGFPDRGYAADGTLLPRSHPQAVIADPAAVAERAVALAEGKLLAVDGTILQAQVASLCVHGDHEGASEVARNISAALRQRGITIGSSHSSQGEN